MNAGRDAGSKSQCSEIEPGRKQPVISSQKSITKRSPKCINTTTILSFITSPSKYCRLPLKNSQIITSAASMRKYLNNTRQLKWFNVYCWVSASPKQPRFITSGSKSELCSISRFIIQQFDHITYYQRKGRAWPFWLNEVGIWRYRCSNLRSSCRDNHWREEREEWVRNNSRQKHAMPRQNIQHLDNWTPNAGI